MIKKLFTLLSLAILAVGTAWAGDIYKLELNGSNSEYKNGEKQEKLSFFSYNTAKHNFNAKFTGATYDGTEFTSGLKMEGATKVSWTSTATATVTIVQSTWSDKTINLDGNELSVAAAAAGTGCRIYTITDVAAGAHAVTRGNGESGIFAIVVEYTGTVMTQLSTPTIDVNSTNGEVTITGDANATKITYTIDGTDPTAESTVYTAPFIAEDGVTVKAVAIGDGTTYTNSEIASKLVVRDDAIIADPVIKQFNGTVFVSCATASTTIEYSLDNINYTEFTRAFTLDENATVYARAKRGEKVSNTVSAAVTTISKGDANKTVWLMYDAFVNLGNSMTGIVGDDTEGITITITGNAEKAWSNAYTDVKIGDANLRCIKLSNGAQNTITLPAGMKATRITFYSLINSAEARTSYWKEFNGTVINDEVPMGAWNTVADRFDNPDKRVFALNGDDAAITFTNDGEQLLFVIALDVIETTTTVNISEAGYATFSYANEVTIPSSLTAYYAVQKDATTITLKEIEDHVIPAGEGVVLAGSEGNYEVEIITRGKTKIDGNLLKANLLRANPSEAEYYTLAVDGGSPVFKKSTGGLLAAHKAYLVLPAESDARDLSVEFGGATGIKTIANSQEANGQMFDLQGRRVSQPTKGLYIVNGKKVIK